MNDDTTGLSSLQRFAVPVRRVEKPWGYELIFGHTGSYCGKVLFVKEGELLSLQYHERKDETIYVHEGRIAIEIGEQGEKRQVAEVGPGHAFHLTPGVVHRWRALEDSLVLEVSTPELDDVVRLEDRYGRSDP